MNDYELYLVKRAYLKKRAQGVTVLGQPIMYDPYSVYKKRKQAVIDAIAAPKWTHDNAKREAELAKKKYMRNAAIGGAVGGGIAGFGASYAEPGTSLKNRLLMTAGGTALGVGLGAMGGALGGERAYNDGYARGAEMDSKAFQTAQKKYDEDVAKAVRDFNMKYTGMEDPDNDAIYRGGIKLHDEK